MTDIIEDIEQSVEEATARGTFSIVDAVLGRAYPSTVVDVYLNEEAAFVASSIFEELEESRILDGDGEKSGLTVELESKFDAALDQLNASKLSIKIGGISEGDRQDLLEKVLETYPVEYQESRNPLTGSVVKDEIENKDRDKLLTNLLWQAQIRSITSADGSVQESFTLEDIAILRRNLPIAALAAINDGLEKVRVSTAVFMSKVNQDFLAKS